MPYYMVRRSSVLSHFGILGMKWGVRRFQDKSGRLTSAGKDRYRTQLKQATSTEAVDAELGAVGYKRDKDFDRFLQPGEASFKGTYETTLKRKDGSEIHVSSDFDKTKETAEEFAKRNKDALAIYSKNESKIKEQACTELYDVYAHNWDSTVSRAEFKKKLKLTAIQTVKNYPTMIYIRDGSGLFGGHIVTSEMDSDGRCDYMNLEG